MAHTHVHWQPQGPDNRCVIGGQALGWENCTACSVAMAVEQATIGAKRHSGCDAREYTGDKVGGTSLPQYSDWVRVVGGVRMDVHVGSGVVSPFYTAVQIQSGRSGVLQGNTSALLSTSHRSTGGPVNHAVYIPKVYGGSQGEPDSADVFDPAADGRRASWGRAAQGPQRWPWSTVKRFGAALKPWGDGDPRVLGPGKFYVGLFPDVYPHAHLRFGASKTSPLPDRTRVDVDELWVHSTPNYGAANRVKQLQRDDLFVSYQWVTRSGIKWVGNHDGNQWVPGSKVRNEGGSQ